MKKTIKIIIASIFILILLFSVIEIISKIF